MHSKIKELEDACLELQQDIGSKEQQKEDIIKREDEQRQHDQKQHEDTVEYLNALNADYKAELEGLLSTS